MPRRMRQRAPLFISVLLALASTEAAGAGALRATQITKENAASTIAGGTVAVGGIDDWALQNGEICAVIADPSHATDAATTGGALIDLGLCGRADDQLIFYIELLNNSADQIVPASRVEAGGDGTSAWIDVFGARDGFDVTTRYQVDLTQRRRLRIRTTVEAGENASSLSGFGGAFLNVRSLSPFTVSTTGETPSYGYTYPAFGELGLGALADAATSADLVVAVGAPDLEPGIAYGQRAMAAYIVDAAGERTDLPRFFLSDSFSTVLFAFTEPFLLADERDLGWLGLIETRFMDLPVGETLVLEREIWVGERADVASVTDLLFPDSPLLTGRVDAAPAVLHVDRPGGDPFTELRIAKPGPFGLRLPPGKYTLRLEASGGRSQRREIEVGPQGVDVGGFAFARPAELVLPRGSPMRLVFVGIDGTDDPDFRDDLRGYRMTSDDTTRKILPPENAIHLTGRKIDPVAVTLRPGRYRALATRGPEFSVESFAFELAPGTRRALPIDPPRRVLETPGLIAADFHVHSAPSNDNATPTSSQIANAVANGSEVLISTEHDHVFDLAPTIESMGLADEFPSIVGLEVTSEASWEKAPLSIGHANVFPVPVQPLAYQRGAVESEGRRWRDIIADLRAMPGPRVIQLNHARSESGEQQKGAFFTHLGPATAPFDPAKPLDAEPNRVLLEADPETGLRDIDFDAMELLNGPYMDRYEVLREDWFALLRAGERIVGTANSDTHFRSRPVGTPRNYVHYEGETVPASSFDEERFVRAVLEGRALGTTGPIVDVEFAGAGPGETAATRKGTLRVSVSAAPWVPVDELRVYVSGKIAETRPIARGESVEIPLDLASDGFITVEVRGEPGGIYALILPDFTPLAFTNPIWVGAPSTDGASSPEVM